GAPPARGRLRGPGGRHRRRGDGGPGAGRRGGGEVRRRQRRRDPPQRARFPRQPGDQVTSPAVVLIGPPGAGKSTVGALLAARLGVGYRDTDADIVATAGKPIAEIFVDEGEPHFRELERTAVRAALDSHPGVLSLG